MTQNSIRVFALDQILDCAKVKVPGFYDMTKQVKLEISFESKMDPLRRVWNFWETKLFYSEGKSLVQFNLSRQKIDATFPFTEEVRAVENRHNEVEQLD